MSTKYLIYYRGGWGGVVFGFWGAFLFTLFINWVSFVVKEGKVGLEFREA